MRRTDGAPRFFSGVVFSFAFDSSQISTNKNTGFAVRLQFRDQRLLDIHVEHVEDPDVVILVLVLAVITAELLRCHACDDLECAHAIDQDSRNSVSGGFELDFRGRVAHALTALDRSTDRSGHSRFSCHICRNVVLAGAELGRRFERLGFSGSYSFS